MNSIQKRRDYDEHNAKSPVTSDTKAVIAIYNTHPEAEKAVNELQRASFDVKRLSVVGKDYHTDEQVVGYYNAGDRMKHWESWGHCGADCGACFSARLSFWVLGSVQLLVAGPLAASIVGCLGKARLWSVV